MKTCLLAAVLAWLASAASPALAQASLIPAHSEIAFTSTQMGVPVHGKFKRFNAQLAFDPRKLETSRIAFTIDVGSVSLGMAELEAEVAKPAWFDAKRFPLATFQSVAVRTTGTGKFDVVGKLTLKGGSRELVVPVAVAQTAAGTTATGTFAIKRLDFGIGDGDWKDTALVSNEVLINFKLLLAGMAAK